MGPPADVLLAFSLVWGALLCRGCDAAVCPANWFPFLNVCYGVLSQKTDWIKAEVQCQNHQSSHLMSILSKEEGEMMSHVLRTNYPEVKSLWIGLRDRFRNGRWRWSDASTSMYTAWVNGKPKKVDESGFCASLSIEQDFLKWNDSFCNMEKSFVCAFMM